MKSNLDWVDELFEETTEASDAERRLDYALALVDSSTLRGSTNFEFDLVDCYRSMDDLEWHDLFVMLRLNQLRCVDNYSYTQRELSRWLRLIAFHEYR